MSLMSELDQTDDEHIQPGEESPDEDDNSGGFYTFFPRIGAVFLDGAPFALLGLIERLMWMGRPDPYVLLVFTVFFALARPFYDTLFVARFGQTWGKMACGVKVITLDDSLPDLWRAILRETVPIITCIYYLYLQIPNILNNRMENHGLGPLYSFYPSLLILGGWGFAQVVTMWVTERCRAIHDFIAGTVVIRHPKNKALAWVLSFVLVTTFLLGVLINIKLK